MSQINAQELFDFDDYLNRVKLVQEGTEAFAQSCITWANRIKTAYDAAEREASNLLSTLDSMTASQGKNASTISDYASKVADSARKLESLRQAQTNLSQAQELNSKFVNELTQRLTDLQAKYNALDPSAKGYAKEQRAILAETKAVSRAIDAQSKTLQQGKKAVDAAEDSYAKLDKQTKELRQRLREMPGAFDLTTGAINKNNAAAVDLQKQITKNSAALQKADALMGVHNRNVGNYGSALKGVAGQAVLAAGGIIGVSSALDAVTQGLRIISDMERIDASLKAVSKDSADFDQTQHSLIGLANSLGISYETLAKSYKGLKAATNGTALEGKAAMQIFGGLVRSGAALKLSNEEVQGAITAVTQIMSKGKVQSEELRQQLAERLPGAVRLLADAMGISEAKLNKMMEQGQLLAIDVLPKLANQLDKTYGADAQSNLETMSGGWNVLTNEVHLFLAALNENGAINDTAVAFENMISKTLRGMRAAVQSNDWKTFFQAMLVRGPLDITNAGTEARQRIDNYADNERVVSEYRTQGVGRREARRQLTQENISNAQDALKNRRDDMNSGNVAYYENIVQRDTALLKKLNEEEKKLRRQFRKDNEQEEINAQRAAAVRKEQQAEADEKARKKREAAQRKADAAETKALNEELAKDKAGSDTELADLENKHQDGIVSEQDYIEQRLTITLRGLERRMAVLRKYNKEETDDYKKLVADKLEAENQYSRAQLKTDLTGSKGRTTQVVNNLDEQRQDGSLSELDYLDQRRSALTKGVEERLTILRESGQGESQVYKDTYAELAKIDATYYKDRQKALHKAYKDDLSTVREGLQKINSESSAKYEEDLQKVQDTYDKLDAAVAKKVATGELSKVEGKAQLHNLQLLRLKEESAATTAAYETDSRLSQALVDDKISALEAYKKEAIRTPAEIADAEKQIADLKAQREKDAVDDKKRLNKESADNQKKTTKETTQAEIDELERLKEKRLAIFQLSADLAQTGGDAVFSIVKSNLDREGEQLDKQKENELRLAGDNADARTRIEEQYAKKKAELAYRQAKADREQALFNIAISTAMGVASVLSTGGGTRYADLGISAGILTAFVLATGALQAAAVLSKPLPEFWQGTSSAPEGFAHVAERGPELQQRRDGSFVYHARPAVAYLDQGDRIHTANQTKALVESWQQDETTRQALQESLLLSTASGRISEGLRLSIVGGGNGLTSADVERAMTKAMREQPVEQTLIDEKFTRKLRRSVSRYTEYVNDRYE